MGRVSVKLIQFQRKQIPGLMAVTNISILPRSALWTVNQGSSSSHPKQTQEARYLNCVIRLPVHQLSHAGKHVHSESSDFHYCETRCPHCEYFCSFPFSAYRSASHSKSQSRYKSLSDHAQEVHETSHGSMVKTSWVVEGDSTASFELNGKRFASGDSGAPMICSMICNQMGRGHLHIDACRTDTSGNCAGGDGVRHIEEANDLHKTLDWIVHDKFWERSGPSYASQ